MQPPACSRGFDTGISAAISQVLRGNIISPAQVAIRIFNKMEIIILTCSHKSQ
jgi:hypothetical protein